MAAVIIIIVLVVIVLAIVGAAIASYNRFVKQRNQIQESWRQIDVELHRRYDLIPNLVETVRAYASHERNTFENVARLRTQAVQAGPNATPEQRAQIEGALSGALRQLMVSVEAYPQLQSNTNFLNLQNQLTETEDRIANGRRFYNANVGDYNTRIESFPSKIIAGSFHFSKAGYFEVNDADVRAAPQVNFGSIGSAPGESAPPQMTPGPAADQTPQMGGGEQAPAPSLDPAQQAQQAQQPQGQPAQQQSYEQQPPQSYEQQPPQSYEQQQGPQSYGQGPAANADPGAMPGGGQSGQAGAMPSADQSASGPPAGAQGPQDGTPPFTGGR